MTYNVSSGTLNLTHSLTVHLSVRPFVCPSVCLSVCLSVFTQVLVGIRIYVMLSITCISSAEVEVIVYCMGLISNLQMFELQKKLGKNWPVSRKSAIYEKIIQITQEKLQKVTKNLTSVFFIIKSYTQQSYTHKKETHKRCT